MGGIASAAIDISDELAQDFDHVARQSGVEIEMLIPNALLLAAAIAYVKVDDVMLERAPGGGDDNELVFSTAPRHEDAVSAIAEASKISIVKVGSAVVSKNEERPEVRFSNEDGEAVSLRQEGFRHF